ncbi:SDR family NAD(P)-dependent oxidoreductase, partial [Rhodococcus pyridinivorans]|uniref:SDR family NAD(P)-dependent oxidoreductase n=2 Tax=Rhodococcus TaxID=1827 RepID=UPI0024B970F8
MDLGLAAKRSIVTGGSRGIGYAIARALATEGADVVIAARTAADLDIAAKTLSEETGRRIVPVPTDTSDQASVDALVARAV